MAAKNATNLATKAREAANAQGVILLVIDGDKGTGFSAQFHTLDLVNKIPETLRNIADQIENDRRNQNQ